MVTQSKSGEGRRVPMNRVVVETLQALRKARKIFRGLVFTSPRGESLHNFGRAWAETVKNAKTTDLRFHDLRHTAASRMVMSGVDLYTVKEILGHKTLVMTQRYSHLSPAHQRQAVERLVRRRKGNAKATDPVTARAAAGATSGDDVTTEEKWWTGGELNSRHRDFQSRCPGRGATGRDGHYVPPALARGWSPHALDASPRRLLSTTFEGSQMATVSSSVECGYQSGEVRWPWRRHRPAGRARSAGLTVGRRGCDHPADGRSAPPDSSGTVRPRLALSVRAQDNLGHREVPSSGTRGNRPLDPLRRIGASRVSLPLRLRTPKSGARRVPPGAVLDTSRVGGAPSRSSGSGRPSSASPLGRGKRPRRGPRP